MNDWKYQVTYPTGTWYTNNVWVAERALTDGAVVVVRR